MKQESTSCAARRALVLRSAPSTGGSTACSEPLRWLARRCEMGPDWDPIGTRKGTGLRSVKTNPFQVQSLWPARLARDRGERGAAHTFFPSTPTMLHGQMPPADAGHDPVLINEVL